MMDSLKDLQNRLIKLGRTLTPEQNKEFREILEAFSLAYYEIGEAYKMAVIELIPSKIASQNQQTDMYKLTHFKPAQSLQDIGIALARNLENQLKEKK